MEEIYQKVGTTTNPALSETVTVLRMAIFAYRSAISGAAFTESEARSYVELFPGIGSTFEQNMATLRGMRTIIAANTGRFYYRYLGDEGSAFATDRDGPTIEELLDRGGIDRYSLPEELSEYEYEYDPIKWQVHQMKKDGYNYLAIKSEIERVHGQQDDRYLTELFNRKKLFEEE